MSSRPTSQSSARHSRNLSQIKQIQLNGSRPQSQDNVLSSLRETQILSSKPVLPAELIAMILDFLPVPDLMRCARVSRQLQEMVYDDTRWVQKLKAIGVWDEAEARQRFEEAMRRKAEAQLGKEAGGSRRSRAEDSTGPQEGARGGRRSATSVTLYDASLEEERFRRSVDKSSPPAPRRRATLADGFDDLTASPISPSRNGLKSFDSTAALTAISRVRSIRGNARQEFGKLFGALNPLYSDLTHSNGHASALIFQLYHDPEQQAQILSSIKRFSKCDTATGLELRERNVDSVLGVFEHAVIREFEQGQLANDIDGRMHRYAQVLVTLNGGQSGVDCFISNHPLMTGALRLGNPLDCLEAVAPGHVDLGPSQSVLTRLAGVLVEQAEVIDRVFPASVDVLSLFLSRVLNSIISDYLTTLFDEAHSKGNETYTKAVSGTYAQIMRFAATLKPTKASPANFAEKVMQLATQCYEKHVDLYLTEELAHFEQNSEVEVSEWEKQQSEQQATTESFFMSNINRQAAKRDFLSSFKKVVMMPVNAFPTMSSKPTMSKSSAHLDAVDTSYGGSRSRSPTLTGTGANTPQRASTPQLSEPPTDALAAKAAIMNSRLEGIKSLFSIEVALHLTHLAKASIERVAVMVNMGGRHGDDAKMQCEAIFVKLLDILGDRHIKSGFDKAVGHLGEYNPRQVREFQARGKSVEDTSVESAMGVEPLVTFLELVNVGDLIQQMVDVFYAQEMVATKLTDRDDFLDPAVKAKKHFEQVLDERVAAGLNKGIDVLMDEVEFICATTQTPVDFNPGAAVGTNKNTTPAVVDIGPSKTSTQIVDMVSSHTGMLVGSTDKNMLDVFMQEVGLRLFGVLCKHFKRQRISVEGAIKLISDINHYSSFVAGLRQKPLLPYFQALRELSQIYLVQIDAPANYFTANASGKRASLLSTKASTTALQSKELATIIADTQRYHGIFGAEEVYEFAERRADWYLVKADVERAMYGVGCSIM